MLGILGVDAQLDGVSRRRERGAARAAHGLAGGDTQLLLDDVGAGDLLSDRVLHLHAGVHLHEVELAALVQQKLDGAGVAVVHGAHGLQGRLHHVAAQVLGKCRRGGLFQKLLMAALDGAVALAERHSVAVIVGEHLHLHVARAQHELFQIHPVVAEGGAGLGAGGLVLGREIGRVVHLAHALAAAAGRGLDEHRVAHLLGEGRSLFHRIQAAIGAGHRGHAAHLHGLAGRRLVAHAVDALRGGADEHQIVVGAGAGELRVLGQKAVARMNRLGAGVLRRGDDGGHDQIALVRLGRADADGLVGVAHRIGVGVLRGVHGHRLHAQLAGGAHDAERHLAAVGN